MRKKLAIIFGTPIAIALILVAIYHTKVQQKLEPVISPSTPSDCVITGCSGQVCAEEEVITTCEFRPEYECYKTATCERQTSGECGWTMTDKLKKCLKINTS